MLNIGRDHAKLHLDPDKVGRAKDGIMSDFDRALRDLITGMTDSDMPKADRDRLAGGESILMGNAVAAAQGKFARALANAKLDPNVDVDEGSFVSRVFKQSVKPMLELKASLLAELDNLDVESADQKAAYGAWIRSAAKLRSPEELRVIHDCAKEQASLLRTIASEPSMTPGAITQAFCEAIPGIKDKLDKFILSLMASGEGDDFGKDEKNAELGRVISMACSLVENGNPPMDAKKLGSLFETLNSDAMRSELSMHMKLLESLGADIHRNGREQESSVTADYAAYDTLVNMMCFTPSIMAEKLWISSYRTPNGLLDPSFMSAQTRDAVRDLSGTAAKRLDEDFPARPAFPEPANSAAMPSTDAQRRDFLVTILDDYLPREKAGGFESGTSTHGRGHIARSYIFAKAMASILQEQGVSVDRNAVLCGIAGHDVGREGRGKDVWEEQSADKTLDAMRERFGSMGEDYEKAVRSCIVAGNAPQTTEAMLLHAADSLDAGRVPDQKFDLSLFGFIKAANDEDTSIRARDMRKELGREADLLQRLTDPYCQCRTSLSHLKDENDKAEGDVKARITKEIDGMEGFIADAFRKEADPASAQFMERFEKVLSDNQGLFPLLSKYYFKS